MRKIKASERPRDVLSGEDVISWGVRTGRLLAASADDYRRRLNSGEINEEFVERLAPVMAGLEVDDIRASGGRSVSVLASHPSRSGEMYAANPVVDRVRRENQTAYFTAMNERSAPKLFGANHTRDLPVVLASGLDPQILFQVPWQARHRIAAEPDRGKVYQLLEAYADDPDAAEMDFGPGSRSGMDQNPADVAARAANSSYQSACFHWAAGTASSPTASAPCGELTDSEYEELFPST